jgi:hydantoinase/carbamoylase family amidase
MDFAVDIATLSAELDRLAEFSDAPAPAVTRVMLGDTDLAARRYVCGLLQAAGLEVRIDAAGNIFARWVGQEPALPAVATGSHTDAIPHSGRYDGTVGVLGGLEAIRALQRSKFKPRRSIEWIMFTAEEPTRYGVGCLGSRLMSGAMTASVAARLVDADCVAFGDFHRRAGGQGSLDSVQLSPGHYRAFVELHIEQGPLLEQTGTPIGVVTAIAAPAALRVTFEGSGGHAGAVLMAERRDALLPAAELVLAVDAAARTLGGADTVATTGVLDVHPRAVNSIPSRTYLEIDVRDVELTRRDHVLESIRQHARLIGDRHRQQTRVELINADAPAACDLGVVEAIEAACSGANQKSRRMISRAYHDSLFMARLCPIGMIFIPCRLGYSHRPDEYASGDAIAAGVQVLAATLARLAST